MMFVYLSDKDQLICPVLADNEAEARLKISQRIGREIGPEIKIFRVTSADDMEPILKRVARALQRDGDINS